MKVTYGMFPEKNVIDRPDSKEKEKKFGFLKDIAESLKSVTRTTAILVSATVIAVACGHSKKNIGDADEIDAVEDIQEEDAESPDLPDVIEDSPEDSSEDVIDEDTPMDEEHEIVCTEGTTLEGEVPPLIANTEIESLEFNGPVGQRASGSAEITMGGEVSGSGLLMLGECPAEPGSVAAFGAQDSPVTVIPSWRIDVSGANAELSGVSAEVCPPPEEEIPISMFNDETNLTAIPALLGTENGRAQVGFANFLSAVIMDGDTETTSPILLSSGDFAIKSIAVFSVESALNLDTAVYSDIGTELMRHTLGTTLEPKSSKKLKISQLDSDNPMLPNLGNWRAQGTPGPDGSVYLCLRPCLPDPASTIVEEAVEVEAVDVTGVIEDTCGKLFAAFDVVSVTAEFDTTRFIYGIEPLHLAVDYSLSTTMHYGDGLDAMSEDSPSIFIYVRRESRTVLDSGDLIVMDIRANAEVETRDNHPVTGIPDTADISFNFRVSVPSLGDYYLICGCNPSLP